MDEPPNDVLAISRENALKGVAISRYISIYREVNTWVVSYQDGGEKIINDVTPGGTTESHEDEGSCRTSHLPVLFFWRRDHR